LPKTDRTKTNAARSNFSVILTAILFSDRLIRESRVIYRATSSFVFDRKPSSQELLELVFLPAEAESKSRAAALTDRPLCWAENFLCALLAGILVVVSRLQAKRRRKSSSLQPLDKRRMLEHIFFHVVNRAGCHVVLRFPPQMPTIQTFFSSCVAENKPWKLIPTDSED